jgi:hypothetical protein
MVVGGRVLAAAGPLYLTGRARPATASGGRLRGPQLVGIAARS